MIKSLDELPAAAAYLRRIGATPINFRTANVSIMRGGYPKVVGSVKFSTTGEVSARGDALTPTPEEQEAIAADFEGAELPTLTTLAAISDPPPDVVLGDPNVFVCRDFDENIVMVHRRYENKDGSKGFIPWTRWSDGEWRMMEPEVLPFFGLEGYKDHAILFIHEGAKSARRVKDILSGELKDPRFPWKEELAYAHHIGWVGGVHAIRRSDWEALSKQGWKRVIIVADNDILGRNVVPTIAEYFHCATFALIFKDNWPPHFDLGDEWPADMFGMDGQYLGPTFNDCLQPATFATDSVEVPAEGRGRPRTIHRIRQCFAEQWVWVQEQDLMVNLEMPNWRMPSQRFNSLLLPFSGATDTAKLVQGFYSGAQVRLTYDPSSRGRMVRDQEGMPAINLYIPSPIKPLPGDYSPFLEFMEYLVPKEEERCELMRWCATMIARPETRMKYGVLMMSEVQGIGKTTLGTILADLVGRTNSSFPGESLIVGSEFNGWMANKRLIVVNEIYCGQSWKAYNKLKPYVTDESIEVNIKFQATYTQPNWTHYYLQSNSLAALRLEKDDRRWFVPKVQERPWSREKFCQLYDWLRMGGLAYIAHWAHTFERRGEGQYVRTGEIAPQSAAKQRLILESRSEAEQLLIDLADRLKECDPVAVSLTWAKEWAQEQIDGHVFETTQHIGRLMRSNGLWVTDRIKVAGSYHWMVVNQEEMLGWDTAKLREHVRKPKDLIEEPM